MRQQSRTQAEELAAQVQREVAGQWRQDRDRAAQAAAAARERHLAPLVEHLRRTIQTPADPAGQREEQPMAEKDDVAAALRHMRASVYGEQPGEPAVPLDADTKQALQAMQAATGGQYTQNQEN